MKVQDSWKSTKFCNLGIYFLKTCVNIVFEKDYVMSAFAFTFKYF